ncbi:MAG: type IV secretion system DNA-binding domain-containing protein [Patescibacteria group bacterium]
MSDLIFLSLKVPKTSENTPEQTAQLLASLSRATSKAGLLGGSNLHISLEVTVIAGLITFVIVTPKSLETFVRSQMHATYPDVVIDVVDDYLKTWSDLSLSFVRQQYAQFFPLRDYADYKEVDPMLPVLGVLSKAAEGDKVLLQFVLTPAPSSMQRNAYRYLHPQTVEKAPTPEGKKLIDDKLSQPLVGVSIHIATSNPFLIPDISGSMSVLNRPDGNSLVSKKPLPWEKSALWSSIISRKPFVSFTSPLSTLNVMELSSLWHLPGVYTKLPNVAWSALASSVTEPPENLPIYLRPSTNNPPVEARGGKGGVIEEPGSFTSVQDDKNSDINFFAKTQFRNQDAIFGIKLEDRLRHTYILGKSGTGKSTLLENMAIDDFKKGRGVAFIDPHGDACDNLLNYIPKIRINDTIYFNPSDREHPISLNILEVDNPDQAELVASGIVSIFYKLYGKSWGPRLEYILRNTLLTLTQIPGSTLPDVIKMLTQKDFRLKIYKQMKNEQLLGFWQNEFDVLEEKTRAEQISSILNKVGQFVNSPLIHDLISHPKSTINLEKVLDEGKILIANLSQGKLGEDNATLLGAMLITKLQLSAMKRVDMPKEDRKEFFLYVDEFQNFATNSFTKILSEARKFRLGLILANQYIAQIPEDIQKAIFGNAGTVISFVVGAEDARVMEAEFGKIFTKESLVSLTKHQIALKMTIDNSLSQPFSAYTLPPFKSTNQNRDKVIESSRQRYSIKKP